MQDITHLMKYKVFITLPLHSWRKMITKNQKNKTKQIKIEQNKPKKKKKKKKERVQ